MKTRIALMLTPLLLTGCFNSDDDKMNTAPVASSAMITTQADIAVTDMLSATDAEGDMLTFMLVDGPTLGTVDIKSNGDYTYTPNAQVTGTDSFTFNVSDGESTSMTATVDITIEAQEVAVSSYMRDAFMQSATDEPLPVNGRAFQQDVSEQDAFDDLLTNP